MKEASRTLRRSMKSICVHSFRTWWISSSFRRCFTLKWKLWCPCKHNDTSTAAPPVTRQVVHLGLKCSSGIKVLFSKHLLGPGIYHHGDLETKAAPTEDGNKLIKALLTDSSWQVSGAWRHPWRGPETSIQTLDLPPTLRSQQGDDVAFRDKFWHKVNLQDSE